MGILKFDFMHAIFQLNGRDISEREIVKRCLV